MILILYTTSLITSAICYEVNQSDEYGTNLNVTTLYPIKDIVHTTEYNNSDNFKAKSGREDKTVTKSGEETKGQSKENDISKESSIEYDKLFSDDKNDTEDVIPLQVNIDNGTNSNNNKHEKPKIPKLDTNNWKIDTSFTSSKLDKQEGDKNNLENNTLQAKSKEFKPSPQLGHFYDENAFVVPTQVTISSFSPVNKNPQSFFRSPGDFYKLNYKPPAYQEKPYKFENTVSPRDNEWKYSTAIKVKPTAETSVKIPAGGLYKLPDPFKEKPSSDGDDDNFGLDFKDDEKDAKENPVKKRGNPWKHLLHLVTALIPAGIILSALTPSIITLETVDNNHHYPNRFSRRSGNGGALPPISEPCKRRLLCELHSDANYNTQSPRRQKHCYKIQCDDPEALSKVLHWLLLYNRSRGYHPYQPDGHTRRGYIIT